MATTINAATWAVIGATFFGPITAVIVTRLIDWMREKKDRRYRLFSTLMSMRGRYLDFEFVRAVNMVQVEFHGCKSVLETLAEFFKKIDGPNVQYTDVREQMDALLFEIAKVVGFSARPIDMSKHAWVPVGWIRTDNARQAAQEYLMKLIAGNASIPVAVTQPNSGEVATPTTPPASKPGESRGGTSGGIDPKL